MTNQNPAMTGEGTLQPNPPQNPNPAPAAPAPAPTDVQPQATETDANASIIAQLQAQNAALMQQNNQLNQQVINLINSGGQFNSQPQAAQAQSAQPQQSYVSQPQQLQNLGMQMQPENQFNPHSLSSLPDLSLEGLAAEIGKDRPKH